MTLAAKVVIGKLQQLRLFRAVYTVTGRCTGHLIAGHTVDDAVADRMRRTADLASDLSRLIRRSMGPITALLDAMPEHFASAQEDAKTMRRFKGRLTRARRAADELIEAMREIIEAPTQPGLGGYTAMTLGRLVAESVRRTTAPVDPALRRRQERSDDMPPDHYRRGFSTLA